MPSARDTTIFPPPAATGIDPLNVDHARLEIHRLSAELAELKTTCSTISNVAISLAKMLRDSTGSEPIIPLELHQRMQGAQISLSQLPNGDVVVKHRERADYPVELEV